MQLNNADLLGTSLLIVLTLLSIYTLILKVREYNKERPDPKLTYATWSALDTMRQKLEKVEGDHRFDFDRMRTEIKKDHQRLERILSRNTAKVSALVAQQSMTHERINALAKTVSSKRK